MRPFVNCMKSAEWYFNAVLFSLQLVRCTCGSSDQVCLAQSLWGIPIDTYQPTTSIKLKNNGETIVIYNFNVL